MIIKDFDGLFMAMRDAGVTLPDMFDQCKRDLDKLGLSAYVPRTRVNGINGIAVAAILLNGTMASYFLDDIQRRTFYELVEQAKNQWITLNRLPEANATIGQIVSKLQVTR